MAIQVFIKRRCEDPSKERELFNLVRKIRSLVPLQSGYLSSINPANKYIRIKKHKQSLDA